jgi:hypothetical protein
LGKEEEEEGRRRDEMINIILMKIKEMKERRKQHL